MRKYKKNTVLLIDWIDTIQDPSWMSETQAGTRPICDCKVVGFYTRHDKELLYLSATVLGNHRDLMTIPIGCITKVTKLK